MHILLLDNIAQLLCINHLSVQNMEMYEGSVFEKGLHIKGTQFRP